MTSKTLFLICTFMLFITYVHCGEEKHKSSINKGQVSDNSHNILDNGNLPTESARSVDLNRHKRLVGVNVGVGGLGGVGVGVGGLGGVGVDVGGLLGGVGVGVGPAGVGVRVGGIGVDVGYGLHGHEHYHYHDHGHHGHYHYHGHEHYHFD